MHLQITNKLTQAFDAFCFSFESAGALECWGGRRNDFCASCCNGLAILCGLRLLTDRRERPVLTAVSTGRRNT
jgi:hypothetical protein